MDRLRRDIRDLFLRRQAGLGDVDEASRRVLAAGLERRTRPPAADGRRQVLAGVATLVIGALVISTFVFVRSLGLPRHAQTVASGTRTSPARTTSPTPESSPTLSPPQQPSPSPSPAPIAGNTATPIDVDLVDSQHGWALLSNCVTGGSGDCQYFVGFTANGGDSWALGVRVGPTFDPRNGDAPRHVHFSSAQDGFVWGGFEAYVTHDGGGTWATATLEGPQYVAFAGRGGLVWAVVYPCKKGSGIGGGCVFQVHSSSDGGRTWSAAYSLPATFNRVDATAFGPHGLLVGSLGVAGALMTTDGGVTWRRLGARCGTTSVGEFMTTSDGTSIIDDCVLAAHGTTILQSVWVSSDGGRTWTEPPLYGVGPFLPECTYPIVITSTGQAGTAAAASFGCTIALTHDGGVTWKETGPQGSGFIAITFAKPDDGWALDTQRNIWVTTDGGKSWLTALGAPVVPKA